MLPCVEWLFHMTRNLRIKLLVSLFALASCHSSELSEITEKMASDRRSFKGKALWGVEDVFIILCSVPRNECKHLQPDEQLRMCALSFSDAGLESLRNHRYERDGFGTPAGEVWLEGIGVQKFGRGGYGHLGAHPCEVRVEKINYLDRGPPWFFEPPPNNGNLR